MSEADVEMVEARSGVCPRRRVGGREKVPGVSLGLSPRLEETAVSSEGGRTVPGHWEESKVTASP